MKFTEHREGRIHQFTLDALLPLTPLTPAFADIFEAALGAEPAATDILLFSARTSPVPEISPPPDLSTSPFSREKALALALRFQGCLDRIERESRLCLFALEGAAPGWLAEFPLAFDRVFLGTASSLVFDHADSGLPPFVGGATRLIARVGYYHALHLLLSRESVQAARALAIGLVDSVVGNPLEEAKRYAKNLPPREVLLSLKHFFAGQRDLDPASSFFSGNIALRRLWGESTHRPGPGGLAADPSGDHT